MNTLTWMRWASISAKPEEGGEISLDTGPLSMSLDSLAETLQRVLQLHRMVSCTIMPHLAPITLITSYIFWILLMICLFNVCRMKTRQDLSSSGIMSDFIEISFHFTDIDAASIQGWVCHTRSFFPRCLARENIACYMDEILWPDQARRRDLGLGTPTIPPTYKHIHMHEHEHTHTHTHTHTPTQRERHSFGIIPFSKLCLVSVQLHMIDVFLFLCTL